MENSQAGLALYKKLTQNVVNSKLTLNANLKLPEENIKKKSVTPGKTVLLGHKKHKS